MRRLATALGDRLLGPGASRAETALALGSALAAAVGLPWMALDGGVGWSPVQTAVAALLAFDLVGGVAVNASTPARRHYHRAGRGARHHLAFVGLHAVHVAVVAWVFRGGDVAYAVFASMGLVIAGGIVLATPVAMRRAVALLGVVAAVALGPLAGETPGLAWFLPVLALKLLVAYLLGDVPATVPATVSAEGR